MKPLLLAALFLTALLTAMLPARPVVGATTIYVDDDNTTGPWDGSAAHPFQFIQDGIDAAADTDTVIVCDGTYTGDGNRDLDFDGKAITLRSENGAEYTIIDCQGTEADHHRGFYFNTSESAASVVDGFTIRNGYANWGGGVYCYDSSPTIANCRVMDNTTRVYGGGIYCSYDTAPTITRCTIIGNTTASDGGGVYCDSGRPTIMNCEIISNTAGSEGGGIYCEDSWLTITSCTITGNTAHRGGGLYLYQSKYAVVANTVLWGDSPHEIYPGSSAMPSFTYCNVEGGTGKPWFGTGCIEADPGFRDPLAGDLHLVAGSPCIDACPSGPADDIDGEARPFPTGGDYDIGADEFVDTDGDGMPDWWELKHFGSTTPAEPGGDEEPDDLTNLAEYESKTDPLDDDSDDDGLTDGAEVNVYGSDPLDTDTDDDGLTDGEEVYTHATDPTDPDTDHDGRLDGWEIAWGSNPLNRWSPRRVTVYVSLAEGDDSYNGKCAAYQGGLDGPKATIQAGLNAAIGWDQVLVADGTYTGDGNRDLDFNGKAISLRSDNGPEHTIIDCQGTEAEPHRGVRFGPCGLARPRLDGFTIRNGHADFGGGIFCDRYSKPTIRNCIITGNAAAGGGGVYCEYDSRPIIASCTITGNTADGEGGGLDCWFSKALIVNCLIADNTAEWGGGICHGGQGNAAIINCTITGNTAEHAGGMYCYHSEPTLRNCILWNNNPDELVADAAAPNVTFCDVEAGWPGRRNIDADPRFVDPAVGDFHIQGDSPCFDLGTPYWAPRTDIEGTARPWAWGYDIGAYEFVGTDADGDGLPDEWEQRYFGHTDYGADDDPDGDGLVNADEGARHANPNNADTDGDGLSDGDEAHVHRTDPLDTDTDQDGLPDGWEVANGLKPNTSADAWHDADGDLLLNTEEYVFGSDPQGAGSPPFVYVDDDGAGEPVQDGTREHPYGSINDAIQAATAPAVVRVLPGTYHEAVVVTGDIWLLGSGAAVTTIDTLNAGEGVYLDGVTNGLVAGFTITTGGTSDMALHAVSSTLTARDCVACGSRRGFGVEGGTSSVVLVNCMACDNSDHGIWQSGGPDLTVRNATVVNNGKGLVRWGAGSTTLADSIVRDNGDDLQGPALPMLTVTYCNIGDGDFDGFDGNTSADPLFVRGPLHDYYLSQRAAGQSQNSPCVNAGSGPATALGLDRLTTRSDGRPDRGTVDMGYHAPYALWIGLISRRPGIVRIYWNARPGCSYVVEWSLDRKTWHEVNVGHARSWSDCDTESCPRKFYRVREKQPASGGGSDEE